MKTSFPLFLVVGGAAVLFSSALQSPAESAPESDRLIQGVRVLPADWFSSREKKNSRRTEIQQERESCLDCHFAEKSPMLAHPGIELVRHKPDAFGCVSCHGGDGKATGKSDAHAPAAGFLKGELIETACGRCHHEPAVPGAPLLSGGRFALDRYGCITCHELPVERPAERYASALDYTGSKVTRAWVSGWLDDPYVFNPASRMPRVEMSTTDRDRIVDFLMIQTMEIPERPKVQGNAKAGATLYADYACESCHVLENKGTLLGPPLDLVSEKLSRRWIHQYLKDPSSLHPGSIMPGYELTDQQAADLTEYLFRGKPGVIASKERADGGAERRGFGPYVRAGCAQCHGIDRYKKPVENFPGARTYVQLIKSISEHPVPGSTVKGLGIPESDIRLMALALGSLRRSDVHRKLKEDLADDLYGEVDRFLAHFWRTPIPLQGSVPTYYNEKVAGLDPESCGTCHTMQLEEWRGTRHSLAMGPGVAGQLSDDDPETAEACYQCHAPLSEQAKFLFSHRGEYEENEAYDPSLRAHGITCAACHVRDHQRYGPQFSELASSAGVFADGHHGGAVIHRAFEDPKFCSMCHQFQEGDFSLNGKLLQDTYNEWKESPQAAEGETCQSCHMPDRKHTFKGIHDPETVRKAVKLTVVPVKVEDEVEVQIGLTNEGAAHYLPTYVTPAIFVTVRLLDEGGRPIAGSEEVRVIQRRVILDPDDMREVFDTRIPPKGTWEYRYVKRPASTPKTVEVVIDVHPDHFYNGFFREYEAVDPASRAMIMKALDETERSPYRLMLKRAPLEGPN